MFASTVSIGRHQRRANSFANTTPHDPVETLYGDERCLRGEHRKRCADRIDERKRSVFQNRCPFLRAERIARPAVVGKRSTRIVVLAESTGRADRCRHTPSSRARRIRGCTILRRFRRFWNRLPAPIHSGQEARHELSGRQVSLLHAAGVKQLPSNERVSFEKRRGHGGH